MDRSKPKVAQPGVAPTPSPPHRRRTQFTIFGLMVLMFVLSLSFSQMFYWSRAEQRWHQQEVERVEQEKAAAQAEKDAADAANAGASTQQKPAPVTPPKPRRDGSSGDAAIAVLMAVALPMLVMIIASGAYNVRRWLRSRRR